VSKKCWISTSRFAVGPDRAPKLGPGGSADRKPSDLEVVAHVVALFSPARRAPRTTQIVTAG